MHPFARPPNPTLWLPLIFNLKCSAQVCKGGGQGDANLRIKFVGSKTLALCLRGSSTLICSSPWEPASMFCFIVGDTLGLFRAEVVQTKAVSSTCLGLAGYNETLANLDAFRVDLFMAQDTPETGAGSYNVKLIAEVNLIYIIQC